MMNTLPQDFLVGAATAAHQVEGNNIHSDYWAIHHIIQKAISMEVNPV